MFSGQREIVLPADRHRDALKTLFWVGFSALVLLGGTAFAQSATVNVSGICSLVETLKSIAKATAVLAVIVFAINSFFGQSKLIAEIVNNIVIALVVISAAAGIIAKVMPGPGGCGA